MTAASKLRGISGAAAPVDGISFVESGAVGNGGSDTCVIPLPGSLQDDDLLLAFINQGNDSTETPPSGWTLLQQVASASGRDTSGSVYYRLRDGTEGATETWTFDAGAPADGSAGVILAYRGADPDDPLITGTDANDVRGVATASFSRAEWTGTLATGYYPGDWLVTYCLTSHAADSSGASIAFPAATENERVDTSYTPGATDNKWLLIGDRVISGTPTPGNYVESNAVNCGYACTGPVIIRAGESSQFLSPPFIWEHAYDAAGPEMAGTYSDTDPVTGPWLDEVSSFNPARTGGGTLTYNAADAGLNGQAAIDFDGTGYFRSDEGVSLSQPTSIVSVIQSDSTSDARVVTAENALRRHIQFIGGGGNWQMYAGTSISGGAADTSPHVLVTVANGADSLIRLDGVTTLVADAGTQDFDPVTIGSNSAGSTDKWDGRIAALGWYDGDVTTEPGFSEWETDVMTHYGISHTPFNPETDITWHSFLWAEGTDFLAAGYSDTDPVSSWPNETGESDADQAIGADQPLYDASHASFNNQPVVTFDGISDYLNTAAFSVNPDYTSGISVILVARFSGRTATDAILDGRTTTASTRNTVHVSNSDLWTIYAGIVQTGNTYTTTAHLFRATFDGSTGNDTLRVSETLLTINTNAGSSQLDGFTLGANPTPTNYFAGQLALFGIYEGDITADAAVWHNFKVWVTDHYGITLA